VTHWEATIEVVDGTGRLELRGGNGVDGLYVDGRPVGMHWPDCAGSVGQEFYQIEGLSLEERVARLRTLVADGRRRSPERLEAGILPLLSQFPTGTYQVILGKVERECWLIDYDYLPGIYCYYPLDTHYDLMTTFLPTQPANSLVAERVEHWKQAIDSGKRPFAITICMGNDGEDIGHEFVLDGHHKLHAYLALGKRPWRLAIQITPQIPITKDDWPGKAGVDYPRAWEWIFRCR
jgi:hypothetical protein